MKRVNKAFCFLLSFVIIFNFIMFSQKVMPFKVSAATNNYYIDYTNGLDTNNGLSVNTPWKTLSKISTKTFVAGDTINLKCGEIWNESIQLWGSGTKESPITLTSYGTGNKPKIRSNAYTVVGGTNIGGWTIKGLAVECTTTEIITGYNRNTGIQFYYNGNGEWANINIEDNEISGQGVDKNCDGIKISMVYPYTRLTTILSNLIIKNNTVYNVGWAGISTVGWNTAEGQDMRSIELLKYVKIFNNTVYNTGNQGITLHHTRYGAIKWNLVHDCGIYTGTGVDWGAGAIWCILSTDIDIMFNEAYNQSDSNNGHDACGFDIDWTCENVNIQYNYAHDNKGPGIETMANRNGTIMYNKVKGNNAKTAIGPGQIAITSYNADTLNNWSGLQNLKVNENIIFVDKIDTVALSTKLYTAGVWSNNEFSNNNIVFLYGLSTTTRIYNFTSDTNITRMNNNSFYSDNGTAFRANYYGRNFINFNNWKTDTGFDLNSNTLLKESDNPTAISQLDITHNQNDNGMDLSWQGATDGGNGISHYNIHRSTKQDFITSYTNLIGESKTNSFSDTQEFDTNAIYYYKVTAEDKCGNVGPETAIKSTTYLFDVFDATHKSVFMANSLGYNALNQTSNLKFGQVENNMFSSFTSLWGLSNADIYQNQAYFNTSNCYMTHYDHITWKGLWLYRLSENSPNPSISFKTDFYSNVKIKGVLGSNNGAKARLAKNGIKVWPVEDWHSIASYDEINIQLESIAPTDQIVFEFTNGNTVLTDLSFSQEERMITFLKNNVNSENIISNIPLKSKVSEFISLSNIVKGTNVTLMLFDVLGNEILSPNSTVGTNTTLVAEKPNFTSQTYKLLISGDINGDGDIQVNDLVSVKEMLLKLKTPSTIEIKAADNDKNGIVTISDLMRIKKHILEIQLISQSN